MSEGKAEPLVRCPSCRKRGPWFSQPHGPFCSHRCKMVDLGKWLGEEHTISDPLTPEHFTEEGDALLDHRSDPSNRLES